MKRECHADCHAKMQYCEIGMYSLLPNKKSARVSFNGQFRRLSGGYVTEFEGLGHRFRQFCLGNDRISRVKTAFIATGKNHNSLNRSPLGFELAR